MQCSILKFSFKGNEYFIPFPIYALSTPFQRHIDKSQISESKTNPSAFLYWSPDGVLKLIVNTYISPAAAWYFQYSAELVATSIQVECYNQLIIGPLVVGPRNAEWRVQTGAPLMMINGGMSFTFSITIALCRQNVNPLFMHQMIGLVQDYFYSSGHGLGVIQLPNALYAGNSLFSRKRSSPEKRDTAVLTATELVCSIRLQNWLLTFIDRKSDPLEPTMYKCKA